LLAPLAGRDVEPAHGDHPRPHRLPQPLLGCRVHSTQQRPQIAVSNDADEAEPVSAAAGPDPRRLASTRVVVVETTSDLLLVVGLLAERELRHAQHPATPAKPDRAETHMHRRCTRGRSFAVRATSRDHLVTTREPEESRSEPVDAARI